MRGTIIGLEPTDYVSKKTEKLVKGVRLIITCKSQNVLGLTAKEEFIKADTSYYNDFLAKPLSNDIDSLLGAEVYIDYEVIKRGNFTFTDIVDFSVTFPDQNKKKEAV